MHLPQPYAVARRRAWRQPGRPARSSDSAGVAYLDDVASLPYSHRQYQQLGQ